MALRPCGAICLELIPAIWPRCVAKCIFWVKGPGMSPPWKAQSRMLMSITASFTMCYALRGATRGYMSLNRAASPGNTQNGEKRRRRRGRRRRRMTLGEITVSYHTGYERQKPALKITAFTHTQLLVRPFSLLCAGIALLCSCPQEE